MASVTVNLTGYQALTFQGSSLVVWNDNIGIGGTFDDAGGPQVISQIGLGYQGVRSGEVSQFHL